MKAQADSQIQQLNSTVKHQLKQINDLEQQIAQHQSVIEHEAGQKRVYQNFILQRPVQTSTQIDRQHTFLEKQLQEKENLIVKQEMQRLETVIVLLEKQLEERDNSISLL